MDGWILSAPECDERLLWLRMVLCSSLTLEVRVSLSCRLDVGSSNRMVLILGRTRDLGLAIRCRFRVWLLLVNTERDFELVSGSACPVVVPRVERRAGP